MKTIAVYLVAIISAFKLFSESYYYDEIGRIVQIAYDEGSGISYSYDNNGNLLATLPISIPGKPTGLVATSSSGPGIGLSWDSSQGVLEYQIFRRNEDNMSWRDLGVVPSDTVIFFDTTVLGDTAYFYQIVAVGNEGSSPYSESTPAAVDPSGVGLLFRNSKQNENAMIYEIDYKAEPDSTYRFESSSSLQIDDWTPHAYSLFPEGIETTDTIKNANGANRIFFTTENSQLPIFFRLVQNTE